MTDRDARSELESLLIEARTIREHLDGFAAEAGRALTPGTHCSIALRHAGEDRLAASASPEAARCDEAEFQHRSGPCLSAMEDGALLVVPDIDGEPAWPQWRSRAREVGFRSSAAVPAHVAEGADIALNLYPEHLDAWDREALDRADTFAQHVARTVGLCLQVAGPAGQVASMRAAVDARDVINQAVGVVMVTNRCTAEEAMAVLRSASTHRNVGTVEVAAAIVHGVTGHDPEPIEPGDDGAPTPDQ